MKSPEFIPRSEEEREEDLRLYGNDKAHTFIPIEEVPDRADEAIEHHEEQEDSEEEGADDISLRESILRKEIEEEYQPLGKEKQPAISPEPELYFHREEGVASVGPDVRPMSFSDASIETLSDHQEPGAYTAKEDGSFSPHIVEPPYHSNKKISRDGNTGTEHDNLKTMTAGKKERGLRSMIRNWFGMQNNEETQQHKRENDMVLMDELEDDPKNPDLVVAAHSSAQEDQHMVA